MLFWWPTTIPWVLQFEIHFTSLDMPSLTKIRYLQIEPSEKKTHFNESIMLKYFIYTYFYAKYVFRNFIPHKIIKFDCQCNSWMNPKVISSLRNISNVSKRYCSNPTEKNKTA